MRKLLLAIFLIATSAAQAKGSIEKYDAVTRLVSQNLPIKRGSSIQVELLNAGLTNESYRVAVDGKLFFVRLGSSSADHLGIDRDKESLIYGLIKNDNIAPKLFYFDIKTGNLISEFISGTYYGKKSGQWLYEKETSLQNLIALMKCYHRHLAPDNDKSNYPFDIIDQYLLEAERLGIPLSEEIQKAIHIVQTLKGFTHSETKVLCHQDLYYTNMIYDGQKLYFIDWEYACWSDPFYDLGSLCMQQRLNQEEKERVLQLYFEDYSVEQKLHLEKMCLLYCTRCALWCIIQYHSTQDKSMLETAKKYWGWFFQSHERLSLYYPILLE